MKLKGFTLMEMILALSLTGVLLLMGGELWQIFSQIHTLYSDQQAHAYKDAQLRSILEQDLLIHENWQVSDQLLFCFNNRTDTFIQYRFHSDYLIRKQIAQSDTFRFSLYPQLLTREKVLRLRDSSNQVWFQGIIWKMARPKPLEFMQKTRSQSQLLAK